MKKRAFSLIEMMTVLLVMSIMLAAFVPTITKRLSKAASQLPSAPQMYVDQSSSIPVGAIIFWYGENYPEGWLPLNGQEISDAQFTKLREVLDLPALPNLNLFKDANIPMGFIIKAVDD